METRLYADIFELTLHGVIRVILRVRVYGFDSLVLVDLPLLLPHPFFSLWIHICHYKVYSCRKIIGG